jgi:hypothetical protein
MGLKTSKALQFVSPNESMSIDEMLREKDRMRAKIFNRLRIDTMPEFGKLKMDKRR